MPDAADAPLTGRPDEAALWNAVIHTIEHTLLPELTDSFARDQAFRLIGLALYARDRGADPAGARAASIRALIGDDDTTTVLLDPHDGRRDALRELLMAHVAADLTSEQPLLQRFSGAPGVP